MISSEEGNATQSRFLFFFPPKRRRMCTTDEAPVYVCDLTLSEPPLCWLPTTWNSDKGGPSYTRLCVPKWRENTYQTHGDTETKSAPLEKWKRELHVDSCSCWDIFQEICGVPFCLSCRYWWANTWRAPSMTGSYSQPLCLDNMINRTAALERQLGELTKGYYVT